MRKLTPKSPEGDFNTTALLAVMPPFRVVWRVTAEITKVRRFAIFVIALGVVLMSCSNNTKPAAAPESSSAAPAPIARLTIPRDSVMTLSIPSDAGQTYSIYYPSTAKQPETTPVLICFDPHGDGRIPIDKYRKWADKFGIAIAGSNSSRNGLSATDGQQIAANMISDIVSRLGFDKHYTTLCGFSGGSKVAINAIGSDPVISQLIYAGAVTALSSSHPISILGFAGNQDMNYTDLLQFHDSEPNSILVEFNGKHEWPDAQTFEYAFYWMTFNTWRQNPVLKDSIVIKTFARKMDNGVAEARGKNNWLDLHQYCSTAFTFLNGLYDVSVYKSQLATIMADPSYLKALANKKEMLGKEANEKQVLLQAFQNQGIDWWTKVIHRYQSSINPSDKRLLGFISLASFSYSNQLLQQQNLDGAEKILAIYELCDPTNTDQLYFHAVLYADKNNAALAVQYLKKAVSNGFKDWQKMEAEQAFMPLRSDPNFSQILVALKKASK